MATKRKTTRRSGAKRKLNKKERQARNQMYAVLLFALGILLLCVAVVESGGVWKSLHNFLLGCFSWCAFLVGPIVIYTAVMVAMDQTEYPMAAKVSSSCLLLLLFSAASQIFSKNIPDGTIWEMTKSLYADGTQLVGGGAVSLLIGVPLLKWLEFTGAAITIVLLIFVAVMLLSGGTLMGLYQKTLVAPVKKMEEVYVSAVESRPVRPAAADIAATGAAKQSTRFNIDVDLDGEPMAENCKLTAKEQRAAAKAEKERAAADAREKLISAAQNLDKPVQNKQESKGGGVFDYDQTTPPPPSAWTPQNSASPWLGNPDALAAAPAASGTATAVMDKPASSVAAPQAKAEPTPVHTPDLDAIITRAVSGQSRVAKPVIDSENGLLNFGEPQPAPAPAPTIQPTAAPAPVPTTPAATASAPTVPAAPAPGLAVAPAVLRPEYTFPPMELLDMRTNLPSGDTTKELKANADRLVDTLKSFGVQTRIVDISRGPAVTRYELQPSAGVKISRITGLADDIALNLAAGGVRIEAPIPNKAAIGIEVPNKVISAVSIREIIDSTVFGGAPGKLTVALGKDISGNITVADIGKMPHVLIAGATGSGKSVCINSLIVSLLYKASPDDVKLLMIDPKVVELGSYNGIPHLLSPVVTDPKKAAGALCTMVGEMLNRYKLFADAGVRDLTGYNRLCDKNPEMEKKPQIVIIIDELADLMMAAPKDVEDYICRLAQMARAAGMHLVIATQRPSVDVITGVIKANIPSRISFAVSSQIDSRTILDMGGAEKLLGRGDMLFYPVGSSKPTRVQGCFVTDAEVERVVEFIKESSTAQYDEQLMEEIEKNAVVGNKGKGGGGGSSDNDDCDELLNDAIEAVVEAGMASTSLLQRRLKVGYARAARLVDEMEQRGIVGPFEGSKPRQVLLSKDRWYEMKLQNSD